MWSQFSVEYSLSDIPQEWELHHYTRQLPILISSISSLELVSNRSSTASFLVQLSIAWLKNLSLKQSSSLLDCLQLTMLLFQLFLNHFRKEFVRTYKNITKELISPKGKF